MNIGRIRKQVQTEMIVTVKVFAGSKTNEIIKEKDNCFRIKTKVKPQDGKANKSIIKMMADYFGISASRVVITKGLKQKNKILEIN